MPRQSLDWEGCNQLVDPSVIPDKQVVSTTNAAPIMPGHLDKRESVEYVGWIRDQAANAIAWKPIGLFVPDPVLGVDFIAHLTGGVGAAEIFSRINLDQTIPTFVTVDAAGVSIIAGNGTSYELADPASFTNYKGRVIGVAGGLEGFAQLNRKPDGTLSWSRVSFAWDADAANGIPTAQSQAVPVIPRVVSSYRYRLVTANFGPGMGNWICFGDRDPQTGWTDTVTAPPWAIIGNDALASNGRHLELNSIQGETILAMREISLQQVGSQLQRALLVLSERSAVIITGQPAQTIDTDFNDPSGYLGSIEQAKVNYNVGIVGPNAICTTPYGMCWAADDEVWLMNGNLPVRVGSLIRPVLQNTPPALRKYWSMAFANGIVFLSLATQASLSERDMRVQHWRLDLRNEPPESPSDAKWYGPQDYEGLPALAGNIQLDTSVNTGVMACSIVSKRKDNMDVVYGAIQTYCLDALGGTLHINDKPRIHIVTFNRGGSGNDSPWPVVSPRTWSTSDNTDGYVVPLGEVVRPSIGHYNGRFYVATAITTGIPSGTEPVWPDTDGGSVVDGGVTWKEIQTDAYFNRLPSYYGASLVSSFLMSVLFKEFQFNQPARDKVVRRADLVASFSNRALSAVRIYLNSGSVVRILGPTPIGGVNDGANDLGTLILDSAAMSEEHEARSLRPGFVSGRSAANVIDSWGDSDTGLRTSGGVIRGRVIQPQFTDDDGIIIDDSNDQIIFGAYRNRATTGVCVIGASLTHGRYANVDTLLTHIVAQMNAQMAGVTAAMALAGFTYSFSPWSYSSAFVNPHPYVTTFTFAFDSRDRHQNGVGGPYVYDSFIGFFFGINDVATTTVLGTGTFYPLRSKRLLALLGLDTTDVYTDGLGFAYIWDDGAKLSIIGESTVRDNTSPTKVCGIQSIPYRRAPMVSLNSIDLDYYVKPGLPFSKVSR